MVHSRRDIHSVDEEDSAPEELTEDERFVRLTAFLLWVIDTAEKARKKLH